MLIFTAYLFAMSHGEVEHDELTKCLDHKQMKFTQFYLCVFTRKPIEMSLFFIYCASLACFAS